MRCLPLALLLLAPTLALADDDGEPPVLALELRVGGALSGMIDVAWRPPPLNVTVGVESAVIVQPWTSFYGQVTVDSLRGTDLAVAGGVRVRPGGPLRLGAGATSIVLPTTAAGVRGTIGGCFGRTVTYLCADVEGTAYLAGDALPKDTVVADIRLVVGIAFHLL
jgi:hypothetical protein